MKVHENRCYMPFILYPPDMYDVRGEHESEALETFLSLTVVASGYVAAGDIAKLPLFGAAFTSLALPLCLWGCKRMSLKVIA